MLSQIYGKQKEVVIYNKYRRERIRDNFVSAFRIGNDLSISDKQQQLNFSKYRVSIGPICQKCKLTSCAITSRERKICGIACSYL